METPRIAIDARHLKTGIGAYTKNLILSLSALNYGPMHIVTRSEYRAELSEHSSRISIVNAPIYSLAEQIAIPFSFRKSPLLHVPHYNIPIFYSGQLLITIHDITHILFNNYRKSWKAQMYALPILRIAAHKAAHVFTVSEYSKRKLVEGFNISEESVTVVYNGVSKRFFPGDRGLALESVRLIYGVSTPYILYVGSLKPHKNISTLLRAYASLWSRQRPEVSLVIVGDGDSEKAELECLANTLGVQPIFITNANDIQLVDLYRAAEVLVLPSFEEGFGLSIVEAMACNTPVICANAASMPEVAGNAAMLFDPYDVQDLRRALIEVLSSKDLKETLRERGVIRAKHFTWQETAARHMSVYDRFHP